MFIFQRSKFYSTKFEPPKKVTKEKKLSDGVRKFLAQQAQGKRTEEERRKKEYEELMALRSDRDKNKIKKMLKVTKSANRSVLEDAVNSTDTSYTLEGPEQPDEDDYGYTSNEASAMHKKWMEKFKSTPEEQMFSKTSMKGNKNADLASTKNRVIDRIKNEKDDEKMARKRQHTSTDDNSNSLAVEQKSRLRKNLYDPRIERETEERKKKELEDERRRKLKQKRPPPPVMDFQNLLKLAAEKQHEPIQVKVLQKHKEPERLLTEKEKRELEQKKKELEERERRRNGLSNKPQTNGEQRKLETVRPLENGRIPKLNGSNSISAKPSSSSLHSAMDRQKPSLSTKDPIKPTSSTLSSIHKIPSKPQSSIAATKHTAMPKPTSLPQSNGKRPLDSKSTSQLHDTQRSVPKQNTVSKPLAKTLDTRNVKPKEFPPKDIARTREFPPRDVIKSREFPPKDTNRPREFPPRDTQRNRISSKNRPMAASKRRIHDDDDEDSEYDSEMADFIDDDEPEIDISAEISRMFNYDRSRYRDEEDDVDNMESSFAQQQREEFISKKIGIQEDLEDMRQEAEEKKRKAAKRRRL